jgi:hypothetical protein
MTIAYIGNSELGDTAARTSYSVPIPSCSIGDFIVMQVGAPERLVGNSALIANTGSIASFTDVFADGYSESGTAKQYILDDGGTARLFWWCGWKTADSGDAAGGSYTVNIKSAGGVGADRCKADVVVYSGLTGVDKFAAQYQAVSGGTQSSIVCPGVTPTGSTPTGDFAIDPGLGSAAYQGGVTIAATPVTGPPVWLLCGAMQWYAQTTMIPVAPLVERESSIMVALVKDAGIWTERGGAQVGERRGVWVNPEHAPHGRHAG